MRKRNTKTEKIYSNVEETPSSEVKNNIRHNFILHVHFIGRLDFPYDVGYSAPEK